MDDSIHFIFCYQERACAGSRRAVEHALSTVGPRIILTSLILITGFGSMAVSEFLPTANFGMFSCLTIFAALVMDLTVLPLALQIDLRKREPAVQERTKMSITHRSRAFECDPHQGGSPNYLTVREQDRS